MDDRESSNVNPQASNLPLPHELGWIGLDWFERMLGTWFEIGRAHSAQAVHATRDLTNAAAAMMSGAAATALAPPARRREPASSSET